MDKIETVGTQDSGELSVRRFRQQSHNVQTISAELDAAFTLLKTAEESADKTMVLEAVRKAASTLVAVRRSTGGIEDAAVWAHVHGLSNELVKLILRLSAR